MKSNEKKLKNVYGGMMNEDNLEPLTLTTEKAVEKLAFEKHMPVDIKEKYKREVRENGKVTIPGAFKVVPSSPVSKLDFDEK